MLLGVLLVAAGVWAAQSGETTTRVVLEEIVARVNNEIITLSEYDHSRQLLRRELSEKYRGEELDRQYAEQEGNVLRDLIDQALLVQKGQELGVSVEADLIKRLDKIREDLKLKTTEDLERYFAERGMSMEDYRLQLRNQILTQYVIQREVAGKILLDSDDVRQYYLQHREEFDQPERVRLREILVSTEQRKPEELPAREQRVHEVLEKIRQGQKFEDVARQYSDAPTAEDGGDLGYFEPTKLAPAIRDLIANLREGAVTDPIRTPQGYLLLQLVEHLPEGIPPFERAEPLIRDKLYWEKVQPAIREYLGGLRRDAFVSVKPGYVDSGAVAPEPKPARRGVRRRRTRKD
jgi:peptidyl-prolyl cis-trans isomerase SurA